MKTGEKIKRLRKEKNLTQEQLGDLIGVKKAAINKYETGIVVNLKNKTIKKLAEALDVNPVWLMDDNSDFPAKHSLVRVIDGSGERIIDIVNDDKPRTPEARAVSFGMDSLPKEQRELILNMVKAMFPDKFMKGTTDDET